MWYELAAHGIDRLRRIGEAADEFNSSAWANESIVALGYLWRFIRQQERFSKRQQLARVAASNIGSLSIKVANRGWWPATSDGITWTTRVALVGLEELADDAARQKSTESLEVAIRTLRDIGLGIAASYAAGHSEHGDGNGRKVIAALRRIRRGAQSAGLNRVEIVCNAAIGRLQDSGVPFGVDDGTQPGSLELE